VGICSRITNGAIMEHQEKSKKQLINELKDLRQRNSLLEWTKAEYTQTRARLTGVINGLVTLGVDPLQNIKHLTAMCGRLLDGSCALYNRLDNGMLCSVGQWNIPPDYSPSDQPEGHICFDVIQKGQDETIVVRDLLNTPYADTDPNVRKYQLHTYVGQAVKLGDMYKGVLCVLYEKDFVPSENDRTLIRAIASAIAVEEHRKCAGEALLRSERKYRTLFEESRDGVFSTLKGGEITYANPSFLELFGYSKEETIGKDIHKLYVDPTTRPRFQEEIEKNGFVKDYEIRYRRKDGTEIDCLLTSTLRLDKDGSVVGYQGIIRDVSEQNRVQQLLRRSEALFRVILKNMGSGLLAVDSTGHLILANDYARSFFGLDNYAVGLDLFHILPRADFLRRNGAETGIREATIDLPGGKRKTIEFVRVTPRGEQFAIVLFKDVTLLVENEERIRRAEQLAVAGEAAARLSHEIKNPLTTILIGLASLEKGNTLCEKDRHVIRLLMEEMRSLSSTIRHLLDAARPSVLTVSLIQIEPLVRECCEIHRSTAKAEGVEIEMVGGPAGAQLIADSLAMRRVLTNLVQNALDACSRGDLIRLGWRVLPDEETMVVVPGFAGPVLGIFVEDSGAGIPENVSVSALFRPFFTIKESGTGLGLTVSQDIAERHGGTIRVDSRSGYPTKFEVLMPLGDRARCWEIGGRQWSATSAKQSACLSCEVRISGSGHLCWEIKGRGVRAETGRWPQQCLECPVFRGGNLSVLVSSRIGSVKGV